MFKKTFRKVEATIAEITESKYLMKSRSLVDFGNLADRGHSPLLGGVMEGGEHPREEALVKYAEELNYQPPAVKVMGLVWGGVRI